MAKKPKLKPLTPAADQIAAYKMQFEGWTAMQKWDADNPQPLAEPAEKWGYVVSGSARYVHRAERNVFQQSLYDAGWDGSHWNWDPDWDQPLVDRVQALADVGLEVVRFYRKRKIDLRVPGDWDRVTFVKIICETVGDDWTGMSFTKNQASVWWKGGGPWKTYR